MTIIRIRFLDSARNDNAEEIPRLRCTPLGMTICMAQDDNGTSSRPTWRDLQPNVMSTAVETSIINKADEILTTSLHSAQDDDKDEILDYARNDNVN